MIEQEKTRLRLNQMAIVASFTLGLVTPNLAISQTPYLDGEIEKLFTTTSVPGWLEGPADDGEGGIWFSDLGRPLATRSTPSSVFRFDVASGETEIKLENTGGANGLLFDAQRNLIAAHGHEPMVTSRPIDDLADETVLVDKWNGRSLVAPNDLALDSEGGLYFTDAAFNPADNAVFYIPPEGEVERFATGVLFNNGIALSPREDTLYVASTGFGNVLAFNVEDNGSLSGKRTFVSPSGSNGRAFFPDGMTVDQFGNLFVADLAVVAGATTVDPALDGSKVRVWNNSGDEIFSFEPPEGVVNLTFAEEGSLLYFTSASSLYRVRIGYDAELLGDCSGDGVLDVADLACVSTIEARDAVLSSLTTLPGDLDGNGEVSFADFLVLSANFNQDLPAYSEGNVDLQNGVDFADFLILSTNFNQRANGAASSVPEPTCTQLILIGLFGLLHLGRLVNKATGAIGAQIPSVPCGTC